MKFVARKPLFRGLFVLFVMSLLVLAVQPHVALAQSASAEAGTSGFGAAFAYAQTIGPIAYAQSGSIGDGYSNAAAFTPSTSALTNTFTSGPAAAFAQAIGTPFGSGAFVQVASFFGGSAYGFAFGDP